MSHRDQARARRELAKDMALVFLGAAAALLLSYLGAIDALVRLFGSLDAASFTAGVFFTSAFTIAPAAVALGHIALAGPAWSIALWGALGAMFGDLALFLFIRDRFADDLVGSIRPSVVKHVLQSLHFGFLKWLAPLLGAAIIFSPLPDEMGLALMGMSKTRVVVLAPLSFAVNFLAVWSLVWFARIV